MEGKIKYPPWDTLERALLRFKDVTSSIDHLLELMEKGGMDPDEINRLLDEKTTEQNNIVNGFLSLSTDSEAVQDFRVLVEEIGEKTDRLKNIENEGELKRAKEEIEALYDKWLRELEKIITGVLYSCQENSSS